MKKITLNCGCQKGVCSCDPMRVHPPVCCKDCPMTKDNWIKAFKKEYLSLGYCGDRECEYEGKDKCFHGTENDMIAFISQVEKDAKSESYTNGFRDGFDAGVEKTNKRLLKIARLAKFWGDRPHVCPKCNHRFSEDALAEDIKKMLSDLLEDKESV